MSRSRGQKGFTMTPHYPSEIFEFLKKEVSMGEYAWHRLWILKDSWLLPGSFFFNLSADNLGYMA